MKSEFNNNLDQEIVKLLAEGKFADEIGKEVNRSGRTIESRIQKLRRDFNARNTTHLVGICIQNKLTAISAGSVTKGRAQLKAEEMKDRYGTYAPGMVNVLLKESQENSGFWYHVKKFIDDPERSEGSE